MHRAPEHDIVYARVFGQDVILLNSEEVAVALLDKRSQKYSNRPEFSPASCSTLNDRPLAPDMGQGSGYTHGCCTKSFIPGQHSITVTSNFREQHFTTFSAVVVMEVTYGYDMKGGETFVSSVPRASDIVLSVGTPELFALCTTFPFVKGLPSWFPGMGWKSEAVECRHLVNDGLNTLYAWVNDALYQEQGTATPSIVADAIIRHRLDDDSKDPELVQAIKESAGTLCRLTASPASVETTHATLLVFVFLMLNHPEVQHRAQLEIDHVVGGQQLPDFEDRPPLPYVDAVLRESLRCRLVGPLGIPHATTKDDVYEGYYIPQGAMIMANVCMAGQYHTMRTGIQAQRCPYHRFLEDGSLNDDKITYAFGFGRRIWFVLRVFVRAFGIEKTEESGNVKWTTGLSMYVAFSWKGGMTLTWFLQASVTVPLLVHPER
ncbi:Cytochrome P450 [Tylopilus felleus]